MCTDPDYTPGQDDGAPDVADWVTEMDGRGIRPMGNRARPAGRTAKAAGSSRAAIGLAPTEAERRYLRNRLALC